MYYRRWTRMYLLPSIQYFHKYDLLDSGFGQYRVLFNNLNIDPLATTVKRKPFNVKAKQDKDLDTKLINNLFLKYPDLKYESLGQQQYKGKKVNTFSYAYAFISEQKKYIKQGYNINTAFELVEKKFHQKLKRKLDQTLLSRGLAIGNRARSFLTIYQQQIEYQNRLKTLRTKRQVAKYQQKLKKLKSKLDTNLIQQQNDQKLSKQLQSNQNIFNQQQDKYTRLFKIITNQKIQPNQFGKLLRQQRNNRINYYEESFSNIFSNFYKRAAYKDSLSGLTDIQIKRQILASPSKIKNYTIQLIRYLDKLGIYLNQKLQIIFTKDHPQLTQKVKYFLKNSNKVKIILLNSKLKFQKPVKKYQDKFQKKKSQVSSLIAVYKEKIDQQKRNLLNQNKRKQLKYVFNQPTTNLISYRMLQTQQQRLARLQYRFLRIQIQQIDVYNQSLQQSIRQYNKEDQLQYGKQALEKSKQRRQQKTIQLQQTIQKFRRLKFRVESRYKRQTTDQLLFSQHQKLKKFLNIQEQVEYQDLLNYLKRKPQYRKLSTINSINDNKINYLMSFQSIPEAPKGQGD